MSSSGVNASLSDALLSSPRTSSEATAHSSLSGQTSSGSSFVPPSPGSSSASSRGNPSLLIGQPPPSAYRHPTAPCSSSLAIRRRRSPGGSSEHQQHDNSLTSGSPTDSGKMLLSSPLSPRRSLVDSVARAQSRSARKLNDSMVYLDGPQIYTCAQCRTHLTSHDEIISKSFHGRHGKSKNDIRVGRLEINLSLILSSSSSHIFTMFGTRFLDNRTRLPF